MVRVPNTESIQHLVGGEEVVMPPVTGPVAERILADINRQVAEMDRRQVKKEKA